MDEYLSLQVFRSLPKYLACVALVSAVRLIVVVLLCCYRSICDWILTIGRLNLQKLWFICNSSWAVKISWRWALKPLCCPTNSPESNRPCTEITMFFLISWLLWLWEMMNNKWMVRSGGAMMWKIKIKKLSPVPQPAPSHPWGMKCSWKRSLFNCLQKLSECE